MENIHKKSYKYLIFSEFTKNLMDIYKKVLKKLYFPNIEINFEIFEHLKFAQKFKKNKSKRLKVYTNQIKHIKICIFKTSKFSNMDF